MEVRYDVYLEDENEDNINDEVDFDIPMRKIELIFSHITEEEKEILEKYNFKYEYTEDNKIKYKENNIKLEVIEKEDSYTINLEKGEKVATLSLRMPNSTRYYYIHYEEITNNFAHYDWYDEEYHTVSEIAEQLNIMLSRF